MGAPFNFIITVSMVPMHGIRRITRANAPEAPSEKEYVAILGGMVRDWNPILYLLK